jgi:1-pyrroline-5-carboxylate dehydrogenase
MAERKDMTSRTKAPFRSEPLTDFSDPVKQEEFQKALAVVENKLGRSYPCVIGDARESARSEFSSTNPASPDVVVGRFPKGDSDMALRALEAALDSFPSWSRRSADERAGYLFDAADVVRKRRYELAAWMVYEVGKTRGEADGEVAEVVDLFEYYGRLALDLAGSQTQKLAKLPDEDTDFFYIPLGAGVVISPWNFPLALTFGMASAAIVAGNTVVIKPASSSPTSVAQLLEIFLELGLPPGVLNFVTGSGGTVGDPLIEDPRTRFVAFTGSMDVGIAIHEKAARVRPGQIWIKRTILEMGGKNAIIVDVDADLDLAAEAVVTSAFGYQGQKCSAGSRAIIDASIYETFLERLVDRARRLRAGDPTDPEVDLGPVIDAAAQKSILEYIEAGRKEGRLLLGGEKLPRPGYFVLPTIFSDVRPDARLAQEEIFGPVLACIKSPDFDEALEIANGTKYGLTGAVFSRNPDKLERARAEFHTGNLYLNRKSTGALMGVHPFGGFNMSGTDSKAGGPDYLLLFMQGKSVGAKKTVAGSGGRLP